MLLLDPYGRILHHNRVFGEWVAPFGKPLIGLSIYALPLQPADSEAAMQDVFLLADRSGRERWLKCLRQAGNSGTEARYYTDISECCRAWQAQTETARALKQQVVTDPATGLLSRRAMMALLEVEVARSRRYRNALSVMVMSLKGPVTRLHDADADRVMARVTGVLRDQLRWADMIGRVDRTDFLLMMPETDEPAAQTLGGRLRELLIAMEMPLGVGRTVALDACFGIAEWKEPDDVVRILRRVRDAIRRVGGQI